LSYSYTFPESLEEDAGSKLEDCAFGIGDHDDVVVSFVPEDLEEVEYAAEFEGVATERGYVAFVKFAVVVVI
jgi:hypothetical protein